MLCNYQTAVLALAKTLYPTWERQEPLSTSDIPAVRVDLGQLYCFGKSQSEYSYAGKQSAFTFIGSIAYQTYKHKWLITLVNAYTHEEGLLP